MKRILTILFLACTVSVGAQEQQEIPAYRHKGYAGSVSLTDMVIILPGFDTSHGYMFNEHHYLGGGLGVYSILPGGNPIGIHAYAEYKAYWFKKRSTPAAGVKVGYGGAIIIDEDYHSDAFTPYGEGKLEPYIGWDWGLKNGKGLSLAIGANILMGNMFTDYMFAVTLPKLTISFNF